MNVKTVKTIIISFVAGAFLTGGFWLGVQNASYFKETSTADRSTTSNADNTQKGAVKNVSLMETTGSNVIADMLDLAGPAVVKIETESTRRGSSNRDLFFRHFFGEDYQIPQQERTTQSLGTGFIISKDGYILTNHHVVNGAQQIKVNMSGAEQKYTAKVIGQDPELDLAVLKIDAGKELPILELGNSDQIRVGEWSVAIGNPYGLDHTVTVGVISAKQRPLNIGQARFKDLLQTDASINPGNSGGPLLNLSGEVIGINTAINAEGQGIGFAIPINTVQEVLDDLINKGKVARPWLGISMQDLTPELARYLEVDVKEGAVIGFVSEGSPAEKAGLAQGDIIVEIDKQKVTSSEQLAEIIGNAKVGDRHQLLLLRNGQMNTVSVTIGEKNYNSQ
ncbi:peptidase S1 [Ammoniphilus oxalaticus]|uniref:Peptidase S1 n=1 Tax=Ammoniphilus oxalaticus TaxID=66863 RepID=A0A419SN56_9BACL|nr:trypsin-like peptidase domain-containing protein [Ammoniphilus oxalaticus]RKD25724.1 peptidase S1 [Ammoniphilus oxalaticus]